MIIINNDNAYISILPISPRGTRRAHMSPEEYGNFSRLKLLEINMFLYYKNKATGDIFEENGISEQLSLNKESSNDPIESNTIIQSNTKSC